MHEGAKVILHLIPIPSFDSQDIISVPKQWPQLERFWPINATGMNFKVNLDGYICYTGALRDSSRSYTQIYRTGTIEAVYNFSHYSNRKEIYISHIKAELTKKIHQYIAQLTELGVNYPIIAFISFVNIKDHQLNFDHHGADQNQPSEHDIILLPEVIIDGTDDNYTLIIKPALDIFYNAFGFLVAFDFK